MHREPTEDDPGAWHRRFAVEANNRAWKLSEKSELTAEERSELLDAAHAAAHHWSKIGTQVQVERSHLLLGRVHALLGNGPLAIEFATAAFASMASGDRAPWEIALSHAVLANAAATMGDARLHAERYMEAQAFGDRLEGDERDLFRATFDLIPEPRSSPSTG
jgi:hypothetical protein